VDERVPVVLAVIKTWLTQLIQSARRLSSSTAYRGIHRSCVQWLRQQRLCCCCCCCCWLWLPFLIRTLGGR